MNYLTKEVILLSTLFTGPTGSGKTTRLKKEYEKLLFSGIKSDDILVLTSNGRQVHEWRENINLSAAGKLNIYTYFGFVQKELRRYWHLVESRTLEPVFLNIETSQFLMQACINELRQQNRLMQVNSTPNRAARQLVQDITAAAISRIPVEKIKERMKAHWDNDPPQDILDDINSAIESYRKYLTDNRVIDYAYSIELYHDLLKNNSYTGVLKNDTRYLIVDDLDESVPAQQEFIEMLLPSVDAVLMAYSTTGGHSAFFGAHPGLAWDKFSKMLEIEKLDECHTCTKEAIETAENIAGRIKEENWFKCSFNYDYISEDMRRDMLASISQKIIDIIHGGIKPNEIAVIGPFTDRIMEAYLSKSLREHGCDIENLSRGRKLSDEPYAQALITIAILSHPEWGLELNRTDLTNTFSLTMGVDVIRSSLLADAVLKHNDLPGLDEIKLRDRIGFGAAHHYEALQEQIESYRRNNLKTDVFLQRVFGEILCLLGPGAKDTAAARQLILSAQKFENMISSMPELQEEPSGKMFIQMIQSGTKAADPLIVNELAPESVILSTPYSFLTSRRSTKVQIWADISSKNWFKSDVSELANPHIISRTWNGDWGIDREFEIRQKNCVRTLKALLHRCREKLVIAESVFSANGFENKGTLPAMIGDVMR